MKYILPLTTVALIATPIAYTVYVKLSEVAATLQTLATLPGVQ